MVHHRQTDQHEGHDSHMKASQHEGHEMHKDHHEMKHGGTRCMRAMAAMFMSLSTVIVAINSWLLKIAK